MAYTVLTGDWIECLRTLESASVHCVVTSPPYWRMRNYGIDGQLGLEDTLEEYVSTLVRGFQEVHRVLRKDGVLWLNMGDKYVTTPKGNPKALSNGLTSQGRWAQQANDNLSVRIADIGLRRKNLIGLPWRVAFALQADGWYLRSDVIWAKGLSFCASYAGACMPESVKDRPTKAHEHIFLLTKCAKYFYDIEAVKEPSTGQTGQAVNFARATKEDNIPDQQVKQHRTERKPTKDTDKRNLRSVWVINPKGYSGAHFATFPPALVEPMIMAGTSEHGVCPECGAPWMRIVKRVPAYSKKCPKTDTLYQAQGGNGPKRTGTIGMSGSGRVEGSTCTLGWRPTCKCNAGDSVPATVLDPFWGVGTVSLVAEQLGCNSIGIELNPEYVRMGLERLANAE